MLFEVDPRLNDQNFGINSGYINWIKLFKNETSLSIQQAKMVGDFVKESVTKGMHMSSTGKIIVDTQIYNAMNFLDKHRESFQKSAMIREVDHSIKLRTMSRTEHAKFTGTDAVTMVSSLPPVPKPNRRPLSPNDVLKTTAKRLIDMGAISEALDVLKILM